MFYLLAELDDGEHEAGRVRARQSEESEAREREVHEVAPHTKDFLQNSDSKALLEATVRKFSCSTTGDMIMITHNDKKFYIGKLETLY